MPELPSPAWLRADTPPSWWPRPPRRLRDAASAVSVGRWVGIAFTVCFVTGVFSHVHQHPVTWLPLPTRPVWIYEVTQGMHVVVGLAAIPLLLAKLWTVYPRLFAWPTARTLVQLLERVSIAVLVAGAIFELATGLLNILQWYPWPFGFVQAHWWVAWLTVGALLVHVAVKAPVIAASWRTHRAPTPAVPPGAAATADTGVSRRTVLLAAGTAAAAVTVVTAGQTVPWLSRVAALAPRLPGPGASGLPINRTAHAADVEQTATDPAWVLQVAGRTPRSFSLEDLAALAQRTAVLPIACVEGWTAPGRWTGVRLREVLDLAGIATGSDLRLVSLELRGNSRMSLLPATFADDPLTLLALQLDGAPLSLDHGYPCRLIAPGRPGVAQTKWLARIEQVIA